ncbi:uncharacterized protein LOC123472373 [Daphnia magna]|uniref:uncharacterized protein LOC123472373 n=1 Tax=Daphnia magna TaxID=35525 RepID=UPI001E1BD916|nr:uncharacterized protein LOC123472373 [Daphnia magna]
MVDDCQHSVTTNTNVVGAQYANVQPSGGQTPYSLHSATSQQQLSPGDGWHRSIAPMQTLHTTYGNKLPRSWQPPYQQTSNSKTTQQALDRAGLSAVLHSSLSQHLHASQRLNPLTARRIERNPTDPAEMLNLLTTLVREFAKSNQKQNVI